MILFYSIFAVFFGVMFGNFATSFIHRIPEGKTLVGNKKAKGLPPHCATCNTRLKPLEYLPLIGFIIGRGKCRHCGVMIPIIYIVTELFGGMVALLLMLFFGLNYLFIILLLLTIIIYSTIIILIKLFRG